MATPIRASTLTELAAVLYPKPIDEATWDHWVETDAARGHSNMPLLIQDLEDAAEQGRTVHALLSGHRGCGKSTELNRIGRQLDGRYQVIHADLEKIYSLPSLDYRQVLFLCAQLLVERADEIDAPLTSKQLDALVGWFDAEMVEDVRKEGGEVSVEGGVKVSFLKALFFKVSGRIFSGGETQTKTTRYIESRLDHLMEAMRVVIGAIALKETCPVLLVLDGLDKIEDRAQGSRLFFEHRRQLLSLPCSAIFTFPIRLWYDPDPGLMDYPVRYILPTICARPAPVLEDDEAELNAANERAEVGRATIEKVVGARLEEEAELLTAEALALAIDRCGGVLRDLFLMLRDACMYARSQRRESIVEQDVRAAATTLRNEYSHRLTPREAEQTAEALYDAIGQLDDWPRRTVRHTAALNLLLHSLCVLEYNGVGWYDLHPLVREYLELEERERQLRVARRGREGA